MYYIIEESIPTYIPFYLDTLKAIDKGTTKT